MKKIKHNKLRNTGLIFEALTRHIISEVLNKKQQKAADIMKKYFTPRSELVKELDIYQTLQKSNNVNESIANEIFNLAIKGFQEIDKEKLNKEKYKLIGEIRKNYDLNSFFKVRLNKYPVFASIYKILEYKPSDNINEHIQSKTTILENIKSEEKKDENPSSILENLGKDEKILTYKLMVNRFNKKYAQLNQKQRTLLQRFIHEDITNEEFKKYVLTEAKKLGQFYRSVYKEIEDPIQKIKIQEIANLTDTIITSPILKEDHLSAMLKYYELQKYFR